MELDGDVTELFASRIPTNEAMMRHARRMANVMRALTEGGESDRVATMCDIYMRTCFEALSQAKGESYARRFAGRLCFRGDPLGQSDYAGAA